MLETRLKKEFKCSECGRDCINAGALANHVRSHKPKGGELHKCPECPRAFESLHALGVHLSAHRRKDGRAQAAKALKDGLTCPECSEVFSKPMELGKHRRTKHGVVSPKAEENRRHYENRKAKLNQLTLSLPITEEKVHEQVVSPARQARTQVQQQDLPQDRTSIDPLIFAIAIGQVKELCRNLAEEHDVPARLFTRQFSELFRDQARR